MEVIPPYEYERPRKEYGQRPLFRDSTPTLISIESASTATSTAALADNADLELQEQHELEHDEEKEQQGSLAARQWVERATTDIELDCIPILSQHEANTERFEQQHKGISHTDGAWPSELKSNEFQDRQRLLRRMKNEPSYQSAVVTLTKIAESVIMQNNTIDLYETYFRRPNRPASSATASASSATSPSSAAASASSSSSSAGAASSGVDAADLESEYDEFLNIAPPSAKTVCVFRDPSPQKRSATKISWQPEGHNKLAVAYSILHFQQMPADMALASYIWDVNNPNQPDSEILPPSPLTALAYNPRSPDHLVGGCYNGLVAFWDLRKGSAPLESSLVEMSHRDPVYDVYWIQSRTGNECVSVSSDGQLLWWDIRKLGQGPSDSLVLQAGDSVLGGTCMDYKSDAGASRYLVGSEQGASLLCDRKAKKDAESQKSIKTLYGGRPNQPQQLHQGRHHGPVYAIQRNPIHLKYFLTVGDWSAKIWMEDLKTPIMSTRYDASYLTDGCWSPTRPGVFFTTKQNGLLDVWDLYHKQNEAVYQAKIADCALSSIKVHQGGSLVAVGAEDGSTTVLEISSSLADLQKDEKSTLGLMLERETKREKNLEMRQIQRRRDQQEEQRRLGQTLNSTSLLPTAALSSSQSLSLSLTFPPASQPSSDQMHSARDHRHGGDSHRPFVPPFFEMDEDDAETKALLKSVEESFYALIDTNNSASLLMEEKQEQERSQAAEEVAEDKEEEELLDDGGATASGSGSGSTTPKPASATSR